MSTWAWIEQNMQFEAMLKQVHVHFKGSQLVRVSIRIRLRNRGELGLGLVRVRVRARVRLGL